MRKIIVQKLNEINGANVQTGGKTNEINILPVIKPLSSPYIYIYLGLGNNNNNQGFNGFSSVLESIITNMTGGGGHFGFDISTYTRV